jgi:hypothetical protein
MSSVTKKSNRPANCQHFRGTDLVREIATHLVALSGPLEGKQIHLGRVALHECLTCGHLMPTVLTKAKSQCEMGVRLFLGQVR